MQYLIINSTIAATKCDTSQITCELNAINSMSTTINSDVPTSETLASAMTTSMNPESSFTLDTIFTHIFMAAAGSPAQGRELKRTRFGFAAESLPLVETISPQLRHQITSGKDVN